MQKSLERARMLMRSRVSMHEDTVDKTKIHITQNKVIGVFNPFVLFLSPVVDSYLIESGQKANDHMLRVSEIGNKGRR